MSISQQVPSIEDASKLVELKISEITFTNLTSSAADLIVNYGCGKDALNTTFSLRLSPVTGLPEISDATISCEVESTEKKGGVVDDVKGFFGFGKKDGSAIDGTEDPELVETSITTDSITSSSTSDASSTSSSKSAKTSKAAAKKKKKKIQTVPLSMSYGADRGALPSNDELMRMKERLTAFDRSDRNRAQREEQYNVLEGSTYRVRDMLTDSAITDVSTNAQRSEIKAKLTEISEWLSAEGPTADIDAIRTKNEELRGLVDPVRNRKDEVTKRPRAVESLNAALQQAQNMMTTISHDLMKASAAAASATSAESSSVTAAPSGTTNDDLEDDAGPTISIPAQIASFTPLFSEDDQERLRTTMDDAREWLSEQIAAQEKLSVSDDPVLLSADITALTDQLERLVDELKRRRPKIPPPRPSTSRVTKIKTPRTSSTGESVVVETPAAVVDSDEAPEPVPSETVEQLTESPTETANEENPTESASPRDEL